VTALRQKCLKNGKGRWSDPPALLHCSRQVRWGRRPSRWAGRTRRLSARAAGGRGTRQAPAREGGAEASPAAD